MGTWATSIRSNDAFADIYDEFIDRHNDGLAAQEITARLIAENQESIRTPEYAPNFWFAIASAQWECKALDPAVLAMVERIVRTGDDLRIWKQQDATPADLKKREQALEEFLAKLKTEKSKPRRRVKKRLFSSLFKRGDCLTYRMDNGNYGGAFVLTDEQNTETGANLIAVTTINAPMRPTLDDFRSAEIYVQRDNNQHFDRPRIGCFGAWQFTPGAVEIRVVGQLPIRNEYSNHSSTTLGFGWATLKSAIPQRREYEGKNGVATLRVMLSEWT